MTLGMAGKASGFMILPENQQMIVDAKIPLIQIRRNGLSINGLKDFGFWSVRASQEINRRTQQFEHTTRWTQGQTAYLEFKPDRLGICTGFLPDDNVWHNRISLSCVIDTGSYIIERYHTQDGVMSGAELLKEIHILRDYLHDYKLILSDTNETIARSSNRKDLEEQYNKYLREKIPAQILFTKREPFEALIREYSSNWFLADEFQKKHREEIDGRIAALRATRVPDVAEVATNLTESIKNMTPEQKALIREFLLGTTDSAPVKDTSTTSGDLAALSYEELKKYARTSGIDPTGKKKADILEMITSKAINSAMVSPKTADAVQTSPEINSDTFDDDDSEEIT